MKYRSFSGLLALASLSSACLLPEERAGGFIKRSLKREEEKLDDGMPIGKGDRFEGGKIAPRGLGTQKTSFDTILSVAEVESGLQGLAKEYGIETFATPFKTHEGREILGGTIGGSGGGKCTDAFRVYFNGNIHARERGSADNILYFVSDLLWAERNGEGVAWGDKSYTAEQVKTALSAGLVFVPLSNPDGTAHDQETNSCWRKNRRPINDSGNNFGVDLNRNFDFLWDFKEAFAPDVVSSVGSDDPAAETYHGSEPFSEPEAKSVKWVLDEYSKVRWFVDLHSFTGDVLYSWGSDTNQAEFADMNFMNSTYDQVRGILKDTPGEDGGYGEFKPAEEAEANEGAAQRMADAMTAGGGEEYTAIQSASLYPTSGATDDWAYSRHFADPDLNLVHAYTVEFGFGNDAAWCPFYPSVSQYNDNIKATNAGFMELLLAAVEYGLGDGEGCSE